MIFDSKFYNKLAALHSKDFDITTNNCGLFVGAVYKEIYNIDLLSSFSIVYSNEAEAFEYIKSRGGWDTILTELNFKKRLDDHIHIMDIVICENAIGIFDGTNGLFAGRATRRRNKLTDSYYL